MDIGEIAARAESQGYQTKWTKAGAEFKLRCPCHQDKTASAYVKLGDSGKIVAWCFGCGARGDKIAAALGLDIKDFFAEPLRQQQRPPNNYRPPQRQIAPAKPAETKQKSLVNSKTTRYRILSPDGVLQAVHVRIDGDDPDSGEKKKRMWWELPDGTKGLGRLSTTALPLYASQLLKNIAIGIAPVLCEGEKSCQALIRMDLPAVGTVCGASATPSDETLKPLVNLPGVVLWPDNDDPGRLHMNRIAASLSRLGQTNIRMVETGGTTGEDAADVSDRSLVVEALSAAIPWEETNLPAVAEENGGVPALIIPWETRDLAEVANEAYLERTAVVESLFYSSAVSMVTGGKHAGKSTLTRWLAICVAQGREFLGRQVTQGPVYYIASSDETMAARQELLRMGWSRADPLRFLPSSEIMDQIDKDIVGFFARLAELFKEQRAVLLVLDMLFDFMQVKDEMGYADTRKGVGEIEKIAANSGTHIVVVHHAPKHAANNAEAAVTGLGSQGVVARVSPLVLVRRLGPGIHNVVSTEVRDPRGKAIALSRLSLAEDGSMKLGGAWKDYMQAEVFKPQILEVMEAEEGQEITAIQLAEQLETNYRTVAAALSQLYKDGTIGRSGSGKKGQPFRYSKIVTLDDVRQSSKVRELRPEAPEPRTLFGQD